MPEQKLYSSVYQKWSLHVHVCHLRAYMQTFSRQQRPIILASAILQHICYCYTPTRIDCVALMGLKDDRLAYYEEHNFKHNLLTPSSLCLNVNLKLIWYQMIWHRIRSSYFQRIIAQVKSGVKTFSVIVDRST